MLVVDDVPVPTAATGQVLLRVAATSLNPVDPGRASGAMRDIFPTTFPWIPGGDVSGTVVSVGEGVTRLIPADAVFGYAASGGAYAEFISVDVEALAVKPDAISHRSAAGMALAGQTAMDAVAAAKLRAGDTVLIHGGAGGVGTLAMQLAKARGARVIATALSTQAGALRKYGAAQVIDYAKTRFEDVVKSVDAVIDLVGGDVQARSIGIIRPGGVLVATNQPPDADACAAGGITGVMVQVVVKTPGLTEFADRVASGDLLAVTDHVESLWNPATLWQQRPAGKTVGKIAFEV
jgi:NADPH:quinone reductase-like Zn-dependent oxidoreductase